MMVNNRQTVLALLGWQWRRVLFFAGTGLLACAVHLLWFATQFKLPATPLAVIGGAVGIFVSFRTNSCYARWWEGRQLWGRLVNNTRDLASLAVVSLPADAATSVVRRTIAHVHALRCALRDQDVWKDADVLAYASTTHYADERNVPYAMLHAQRAELAQVQEQAGVYVAFDRILGHLHDAQGGCERLKRTPFPRAYNFIADRLVLLYGCMLPFSLVVDLGWFTIPMNVLVCMSFALIGEAGRVLEDPFSTFWNGLPLSALCRTIEINLRQRLGETNVPPMHVPDANGILM